MIQGDVILKKADRRAQVDLREPINLREDLLAAVMKHIMARVPDSRVVNGSNHARTVKDGVVVTGRDSQRRSIQSLSLVTYWM